MSDVWICGKCEDLCEAIETDVGNYEEFWGAKVWRAAYEIQSDCCGDDCYTPQEWRENGWDAPKNLGIADLGELGFLTE